MTDFAVWQASKNKTLVEDLRKQSRIVKSLVNGDSMTIEACCAMDNAADRIEELEADLQASQDRVAALEDFANSVLCAMENAQDEGDRVYLASTNDKDMLHQQAKQIWEEAALKGASDG